MTGAPAIFIGCDRCNRKWLGKINAESVLFEFEEFMNLEAKKNTCKNGGNDLLLTIMAEKKEWTVDFIKQLIDHGMSFYSIMFEIIKIKYGSLSCFQKKTGIDKSVVAKWGNFKRIPNTKNRNDLHRFLGIDLYQKDILDYLGSKASHKR